MIPKSEMQILEEGLPKLTTVWNSCRIFPVFTRVTSIQVLMSSNETFSIAFSDKYGWKTHIAKAKTRKEVLDIIGKFDFKLYRVMYSIFEDHVMACKITIGE